MVFADAGEERCSFLADNWSVGFGLVFGLGFGFLMVVASYFSSVFFDLFDDFFFIEPQEVINSVVTLFAIFNGNEVPKLALLVFFFQGILIQGRLKFFQQTMNS